jgi:hypothetical protein
MRPAVPPSADRRWHQMELELVQPAEIVTAAEIFLPPSHCRYV